MRIYDPASFVVSVPMNGFAWSSPDAHRLAHDAVLIPTVSARWRPAYPLRTPALHRRFADTAPTRSDVQTFANRFGLLDWRNAAALSLPKWAYEIRVVRAIVDVAGALTGNGRTLTSRDRLAERFRCERTGDMAVIVYCPPSGDVADAVEPVRFADGQSGLYFNAVAGTGAGMDDAPMPDARSDPASLALLWIQGVVNERLTEHCAVRLASVDDSRPGHLPVRLQLAPKSLLGAIFLALADELEGNRTYRRCLACGKWIGIAAGAGKRADARFCDGACRQRFRRAKLSSPAPITKPRKVRARKGNTHGRKS